MDDDDDLDAGGDDDCCCCLLIDGKDITEGGDGNPYIESLIVVISDDEE